MMYDYKLHLVIRTPRACPWEQSVIPGFGNDGFSIAYDSGKFRLYADDTYMFALPMMDSYGTFAPLRFLVCETDDVSKIQEFLDKYAGMLADESGKNKKYAIPLSCSNAFCFGGALERNTDRFIAEAERFMDKCTPDEKKRLARVVAYVIAQSSKKK